MVHPTAMTGSSSPVNGPERTCVGCGSRSGQGGLVRLALASGQVVVDREKRGGRGAWLHPAEACLERAIKRRVFGRAFREAAVVVDAEVLRVQLTRSGCKH